MDKRDLAAIGKRLTASMVRGLESAGFVNVRGRYNHADYGHGLVVGALADCPCGLGTSSLAQCFDGNKLRLPVETLERMVERDARIMGLAHIEKDKAEGRWA